MIITIGGNLGSGKTTLADALASHLGYEQLYVGKIFRDLADERGVSIEEIYSQLRHDPDLEKSIDLRQTVYMREHNNAIVQGRVAWYFAKQSPFPIFNIFLSVDPRVGAERAHQRPENNTKTVEEIVVANAFRATLERERYQKLYGIENFLDPAHYDFIFDTTALTPQDVFQHCCAAIARQQ